MYDIIIIGAGPAGLTAAIYARRAMKKVLLLEAKSYGGQIINSMDIENYPGELHISGIDFATKLYNQAKELGTEIKYQKAVEIVDNGKNKKIITTKEEYECLSVIIATGSETRKLGIENEDKFIGKGISYCATCDGNFFKNKSVAVVGGGNTALEDALYLSNIANEVFLIHRRDKFRGEEKTLTKLKEKENVKIIYNSTVTKLNGEDYLTSIDIVDKENNIKQLIVSCLFIAIGRIPENENFSKVIKLDEFGYIESDETCHTNTKGIFVAGDNRKKSLRQLVTATSDGAIAATEAIKYLNEI